MLCVTLGSFFDVMDIPPFGRITSDVVTASQRNRFHYGFPTTLTLSLVMWLYLSVNLFLPRFSEYSLNTPQISS